MVIMVRMLVLLALLSSPFRAAAHEVLPVISNMTVADGRVVFELRMNAEAFVAGIDLDGVTDTNAAAESDLYDSLRALDPVGFEGEVRAFMPGWLAGLKVMAGDTAVTLELDEVRVERSDTLALPRETRIRASGALPEGATVINVTWPVGAGSFVLRQQGVEEPYTGLLSGGDSSGPIPIAGGAARGGWQTFVDYIPVGFDHILPKGLDHILFVLGLFFLSTRLGPLLWQVSAFTLAHTVTLALGALGIVAIPATVVEPLIAASIVYVAVENIYSDGLSRTRPFVVFGFGLLHGLGFASVLGEFGLPAGQFVPALIAASIVYVAVENIYSDGLSRTRPFVVFGFGLLHGLGFASVLGEFGLPAGQFVPALIGFNIGVELGQLTVIAIAFLAVGAWFGAKPWYRAAIAIPASGLIALVGAYWFVERVFL